MASLASMQYDEVPPSHDLSLEACGLLRHHSLSSRRHHPLLGEYKPCDDLDLLSITLYTVRYTHPIPSHNITILAQWLLCTVCSSNELRKR